MSRSFEDLKIALKWQSGFSYPTKTFSGFNPSSTFIGLEFYGNTNYKHSHHPTGFITTKLFSTQFTNSVTAVFTIFFQNKAYHKESTQSNRQS